jgi:Sec-independent protein secretion pathway component TatC
MIPLIALYEASVQLAKRFGEPKEISPSDAAPESPG